MQLIVLDCVCGEALKIVFKCWVAWSGDYLLNGEKETKGKLLLQCYKHGEKWTKESSRVFRKINEIGVVWGFENDYFGKYSLNIYD